MSDQMKRAGRPALAAAVSVLGLSLGVSVADAQVTPATPVTPAANTQGVLIGLSQPSSEQIKSSQIKSNQVKNAPVVSDQLKTPTASSVQWKGPVTTSIQTKSNGQ